MGLALPAKASHLSSQFPIPYRTASSCCTMAVSSGWLNLPPPTSLWKPQALGVAKSDLSPWELLLWETVQGVGLKCSPAASQSCLSPAMVPAECVLDPCWPQRAAPATLYHSVSGGDCCNSKEWTSSTFKILPSSKFWDLIIYQA